MDEMTAKLYDVDAIRADFPILSREVHGRPLVYLDSAASAQKPRQVLDALMRAYDTYSNVHRGLHFLSEASTDAYEAVRGSVASFIGAGSGNEIVFHLRGHDGVESDRAAGPSRGCSRVTKS